MPTRTPAAQALLEEILSMQITQTAEASGTPEATRRTETTETEGAGEHLALTTRRSGRRPLAFAGAVAAAAAALAVSFVVLDSGQPSSAATVEAALARSSSLLAGSGRAELTWRMEGDGGVGTGVESWEISGDDSSMTMATALNGIPHECLGPTGDPPPDLSTCHYEGRSFRTVDGQEYAYMEDPPGAGTYGWFRFADGIADGITEMRLDPATVLDELQPAGSFEEVGEEQVDGVESTRLRATNPRQTPLADFENVVLAGDTVTSLEVWVDHDGLVRRIDLVTGSSDPRLRTASWSIRFFDLGAPMTIQAPTTYQDLPTSG